MCFIGVELEHETSTSPPKKKSWIRPCGLTDLAEQCLYK